MPDGRHLMIGTKSFEIGHLDCAHVHHAALWQGSATLPGLGEIGDQVGAHLRVRHAFELHPVARDEGLRLAIQAYNAASSQMIPPL